MIQATNKDAYQLFHKGIQALSEMEYHGIKVDTDYVNKTYEAIGARIRTLEQELKEDEIWKIWKKRFGERANLGSPAQRGTVFFGILEYPFSGNTKRDKKGNLIYEADEEKFADIDHPFVKKYFRIQKLRKSQGTYIGGIRKEMYNGFIHPSYSLAGGKEDKDDSGGRGGAISYRGSSSNPNFQNMPVRDDEMAKLIRPCFIPRDKNNCLVECDFSTLEVRVSACYNKDPVLMRYVKDPKTDMHKDAARRLFFMDDKAIEKCSKNNPKHWKMIRHIAKNKYVFPQFYGDYYVACAKNMWKELDRGKFEVSKGVTVLEHLKQNGIKKMGECNPDKEALNGTFEAHVRKYEKYFWYDQFKVYTKWKKSWYEKYLRRGWFPSYTGFTYRGVYRKNQVTNFSIQGSAFHCLLWSIIEINKRLKKYGMKARIIGQIHDSILADVPKREVQQYLSIAHEVMTERLAKHWDWITVPMQMEPDVSPPGQSWYHKQPWEFSNDRWNAKA